MKYKSPHPQDLSFPKDQDLRVLGYADRGAEEEEAEEEADRWIRVSADGEEEIVWRTG